MADYHLDCKGQQCPRPIIEISRKMVAMSAGQTLRVEATDGAFEPDLKAWLAMRREGLLEFGSTGPISFAVLEKR